APARSGTSEALSGGEGLPGDIVEIASASLDRAEFENESGSFIWTWYVRGAMRIDMMEFIPVTLQRKETFAIARSSSAIAEVVFLAVHSGRRVGHGCAAPTEVTRENVHSVMNTLQSFARSLPGIEFEKPYQLQERMDKLAANQPSARAALEMALFDLAAQAAGVPLFAYLGGRRDRMPTDMTIGIMDKDAAVDRARRWVAVGFQALKVKVGRARAAGGVSCELLTHGGIVRSMQVDWLRESAGHPTMVGCMGAPQLSIAAGLHFALAQKNVRWLDLDSHFNFASDPSSGLRFENGQLIAPSGPGLGIDVQFPT